jgi:hypothetical protein
MARRRALALLAFASLLGGAAAEPERPPRASLIVGEWVGGRFLRWASCPNQSEDTICTYFVMSGRIAGVRTLSGPYIPREISLHVVTTLRPWPGREIVMLVQRNRPHSDWLGLVLESQQEGEACVDAAQLEGFGIAAPRHSRRVGAMICTRF